MTAPKKRLSNIRIKDRYLPLVVGLAVGLFPVAYLYARNFFMFNSWAQLWFFVSRFILLPMVGFYLLYFLFRNNKLLYKNRILPPLNAVIFVILSLIAGFIYIGWKKILFVILVTVAVLVLHKLVKRLFYFTLFVQFALFLAFLYNLGEIGYKYLTYSDNWMDQPDHIEQVTFKKTPNIYIIQPDGYTGFSELGRGYYNYDNSDFEQWLKDEGFSLYPDFRSNYPNTLISNSSLLSMTHHHYRLLDERKVIMGKSKVVDILNSNGYRTHFLAEKPYLIANHPRISFDHTNFQDIKLPYLSRSWNTMADAYEDLAALLEQQGGRNFYFVEKISPGHVSSKKRYSKGVEKEREMYLKNIPKTNEWLRQTIDKITVHDPGGLIVILADHAGYVGFEYTAQRHIKTTDRDLIFSVFSAALAIKWPDEAQTNFDGKLKTSVNLFRILFTWMSEDPTLLENLQEDGSYIRISEGATKGVYRYIDGGGNIDFKKTEASHTPPKGAKD